MLNSLSQTYQHDGVVKVPGLLDKKWVAQLLSVIENVRQDEKAYLAQHRTAEVSHAQGRMTIRWLWRDNPDVATFFTDAGVHPVVAAIIGARRLQYWYDLTFIHEAGMDDAEGTPWHHDIAAFPVKGTQIPSLWIALGRIDQSSSPLQCIRGSHRDRLMYRPPVYIDPNTPCPTGYAEAPNFKDLVARGEVEVITWTFEPGDALIINPYTIHGAPPNASQSKPRISFTTRWMGDDVVWGPDTFSMKVPGVDLAKVPLGQRPEGKFFPDAPAGH